MARTAGIPLAAFTTLGLGGPARRLVAAAAEAELVAAVRSADERGEPLLVLGGGSNLVIADEGFPGTVVRVASRGVRHELQDPGVVRLTVAAGEDWDTVVTQAIGDGLAGLECLSGIPGLAGATPIQNVGAYGQEVAQTLVTVRAYDRARRAVTELSHADCGFGYRTSAFKRSAQAGAVTGRFIVLAVTFRLQRRCATWNWPARSAWPRGTGRHWPTCGPRCWGCAAARAWCWTPPTPTAAAPARSSPTRFLTCSSSPTWSGPWPVCAGPVCRYRGSRPSRAWSRFRRPG